MNVGKEQLATHGLYLALVTGMLMANACDKSNSKDLPKNVAQLHAGPTYGWTVCPRWNALIYSDGRDLLWKDLDTGRVVDLTGIPRALRNKWKNNPKSKPSPGSGRQSGSELYPACSPDGTLLAFAANRANDNEDPTDDSDSDIWAIEITPELAATIQEEARSAQTDKKTKPASFVTEKKVTYYIGPLKFRQLTNIRKVQETMPRFGPHGRFLYFLGRNNELWRVPLNTSQ